MDRKAVQTKGEEANKHVLPGLPTKVGRNTDFDDARGEEGQGGLVRKAIAEVGTELGEQKTGDVKGAGGNEIIPRRGISDIQVHRSQKPDYQDVRLKSQWRKKNMTKKIEAR